MTPNLPEDVQKPDKNRDYPSEPLKPILDLIHISGRSLGNDFVFAAQWIKNCQARIEELEKEYEALKAAEKLDEQDYRELNDLWLEKVSEVEKLQQQIQELKERKGAFDEEQDLEGYLQKYIGSMFGGLGAASIEHFLKTGTLNGTFRLQLTRLVYETHYQLNKGRESADPSAEIQSLKEENVILKQVAKSFDKYAKKSCVDTYKLMQENARLKQESEVLKMLRNDEPTLKEMED